MISVAVVYASRHGHTVKIAERLATELRAAGATVTRTGIGAASTLDPRAFDAMVVIGSIHMGHHDPHLVGWAREHAAALGERPSALVSVSMSAASGKPEGLEQAQQYIDRFAEDTGWIARHAYAVAGALQYREYGFVTRRVIRTLARKGGLSTDIGHDTEYTDWEQVGDVARDVLSDLAKRSPLAAH